MSHKKYIYIGKLNQKLFQKINQTLITNKVVFTYERINHVKTKRVLLFDEVRNILPEALYNPDYVYSDWNNRKNTLILIKSIDSKSNLNIVLKIAIPNDLKHTQNSIITMIKIGNKTLKKIIKNKKQNLLYKKLDNCE